MKMADRSLPIRDLRRNLFPQIQGILKPGGFYLEEDPLVYGQYQCIDKYDLCHEDQSKREVIRLLEGHKKAHEFHSHEIAHKIGRLVVPYLMEEYQLCPDEEIAHIIEFHCGAVLDLLARSLQERDITVNALMSRGQAVF
jgi:hypothetical protein